MRLGFKSWAVVAVDMVLLLRFAIIVLAPYGVEQKLNLLKATLSRDPYLHGVGIFGGEWV